MNSLNILSALGSPALPPSQPETHREKKQMEAFEDGTSDKGLDSERENTDEPDTQAWSAGNTTFLNRKEGKGRDLTSEKSPLLPHKPIERFDDDIKVKGSWKSFPKRIASAVVGSLRVIVSTLIAPGYYIIAYFHNENGKFSTRSPSYRLDWMFRRNRRKGEITKKHNPHLDENQLKQDDKLHGSSLEKPTNISTASSLTNSTESDADTDIPTTPDDTPSRNTRARSKASKRKGEKNEERERPRRKKITGSAGRKEQEQKRSKEKARSSRLQFDSTIPETEAAAALLKSPKSPATGLKVTKYPKIPTPPQPLIPRRQPSYVFGNTSGAPPNKTLIIDLDETLIHSMAKGGRMSTGHMVEVKLQHPVGIGGTTIGPQVPILYYVHKRPYCDEFLRKVCLALHL